MTDYSKLSDFEINKQVAFHIGLRTVERAEEGEFDPCNNPADAWPIILSNKIGINPGTASDKWAAHYCNWDIAIADANPLRAAMIVFLMMQDANHANS
ncbi:phage protein NinX family protein [Atlantibacter hermannii]|uniref:phage protein NinX family protein n=1 Tax=Atlantibacter hermannii TaxID=565 RepID=UPI00289F7E5F|nr:phage protein NinX family protein [Atlantibacter hermannii]